MDYKQVKDKIVCVRDASGIVSYDPAFSVNICFDESIPWKCTEKEICRLSDNSFAVADTPGAFNDMKQSKLDKLSASFDARVAGSFTTSQGYKMQFDTSDAIKMEGAIKLLEATGATEGYLTQADDTTVYNVPLDVMKAVLVEMMTAFAACHARKQELRTLINAAQSKEDLDTIEIAWPV